MAPEFTQKSQELCCLLEGFVRDQKRLHLHYFILSKNQLRKAHLRYFFSPSPQAATESFWNRLKSHLSSSSQIFPYLSCHLLHLQSSHPHRRCGLDWEKVPYLANQIFRQSFRTIADGFPCEKVILFISFLTNNYKSHNDIA